MIKGFKNQFENRYNDRKTVFAIKNRWNHRRIDDKTDKEKTGEAVENCNHHRRIDDIVEKEKNERNKTGAAVKTHNHHRQIDDIVEKEKNERNKTGAAVETRNHHRQIDDIVEKEKNERNKTGAAVETRNHHRQIDDIVEKEKNERNKTGAGMKEKDGKTGAAVGNRNHHRLYIGTHHRDDPQLNEPRGTPFDRDNPPFNKECNTKRSKIYRKNLKNEDNKEDKYNLIVLILTPQPISIPISPTEDMKVSTNLKLNKNPSDQNYSDSLSKNTEQNQKLPIYTVASHYQLVFRLKVLQYSTKPYSKTFQAWGGVRIWAYGPLWQLARDINT